METLSDVIIPSFVNAHLFWIIQKKDLILRSAMNKLMKVKRAKPISPGHISEQQMVGVNIDDYWARAIVEKKVKAHDEIKYVCWLPDYGIMRSVVYVFPLPEGLEKCPYLAKQASLHNVVNLTSELVLGSNGYELKLKKTSDDVQGIRKVALDYIEGAYKIDFLIISEDTFNLYGDIIFLYQDDFQKSLTELLKEKQLLTDDERLFALIENSRFNFKKTFFYNSGSWQQALDRTEKRELDEIIFNREKNNTMEYFQRKSDAHRT